MATTSKYTTSFESEDIAIRMAFKAAVFLKLLYANNPVGIKKMMELSSLPEGDIAQVEATCVAVSKKMKADLAIVTSFIEKNKILEEARREAVRDKVSNKEGMTGLLDRKSETMESIKEGVSLGNARENLFSSRRTQSDIIELRRKLQEVVRILEENGNNASIADAEILSRYLGVLTQPVVARAISKLSGGSNGTFDASYLGRAAFLKKSIDDSSVFAKDPYVVARRILLNTYGSDTLEVLDGHTRWNPVTESFSDTVPFLKGIDFTVKEGLLEFARRVDEIAKPRFNQSTRVIGKGDAKYFGETVLSKLFTERDGKFFLSDDVKKYKSSEVREFLESTGNFVDLKRNNSQVKRTYITEDDLKQTLTKLFTTAAGVNRLVENKQFIEEISNYLKVYKLWQSLQTMLISSSRDLSFVDDRIRQGKGSDKSIFGGHDVLADRIVSGPLTAVASGSLFSVVNRLVNDFAYVAKLKALPIHLVLDDENLKKTINSKIQETQELIEVTKNCIREFLSNSDEVILKDLKRDLNGRSRNLLSLKIDNAGPNKISNQNLYNKIMEDAIRKLSTREIYGGRDEFRRYIDDIQDRYVTRNANGENVVDPVMVYFQQLTGHIENSSQKTEAERNAIIAEARDNLIRLSKDEHGEETFLPVLDIIGGYPPAKAYMAEVLRIEDEKARTACLGSYKTSLEVFRKAFDYLEGTFETKDESRISFEDVYASVGWQTNLSIADKLAKEVLGKAGIPKSRNYIDSDKNNAQTVIHDLIAASLIPRKLEEIEKKRNIGLASYQYDEMSTSERQKLSEGLESKNIPNSIINGPLLNFDPNQILSHISQLSTAGANEGRLAAELHNLLNTKDKNGEVLLMKEDAQVVLEDSLKVSRKNYSEKTIENMKALIDFSKQGGVGDMSFLERFDIEPGTPEYKEILQFISVISSKMDMEEQRELARQLAAPLDKESFDSITSQIIKNNYNMEQRVNEFKAKWEGKVGTALETDAEYLHDAKALSCGNWTIATFEKLYTKTGSLDFGEEMESRLLKFDTIRESKSRNEAIGEYGKKIETIQKENLVPVSDYAKILLALEDVFSEKSGALVKDSKKINENLSTKPPEEKIKELSELANGFNLVQNRLTEIYFYGTCEKVAVSLYPDADRLSKLASQKTDKLPSYSYTPYINVFYSGNKKVIVTSDPKDSSLPGGASLINGTGLRDQACFRVSANSKEAAESSFNKAIKTLNSNYDVKKFDWDKEVAKQAKRLEYSVTR